MLTYDTLSLILKRCEVTACHFFLGGRRMPRQTFYNLPVEKKEVLVEAGEKEFSRVPLFEASIANIVKDAGIPRGSFYQYFDDKEDLYFYILKQYATEKKIQLIALLEKHDGNIFEAITDLYLVILNRIEDDASRQFFQNVFLHLDFETERAFLSNINHSVISEQYMEIKKLINTADLNIENEKELFHIVQIMLSMMVQNIVRKFAVNLTREEVVMNFSTQIQLLKKGFKRN